MTAWFDLCFRIPSVLNDSPGQWSKSGAVSHLEDMSKSEPFHIAFSTTLPRDLRYLGALSLSILDHFRGPGSLVFHLMHSDLSAEQLEEFSASLAPFPCELQLHPMEEVYGDRQNYDGFGYWGRIWIADVLTDLDRVLYLDCDMLCYADISELWDLDLGDDLIAAVLDPGGRFHDCIGSLHVNAKIFDLEYGLDSSYFNSGLMLMNLKAWREEAVSRQVDDVFYGRYKAMRFHDQDGLNILLNGRVIYIDPSWNLLESVELYENWDFELYERFQKPLEYFQPRFRHFSGNMKPDGANARWSVRECYYHYLDRTAWSGWRATGFDGLFTVVKSKLLEFHYLVTRGLRQQVLHKPWSKLARLTMRDPYLPVLYLGLPIYRLIHRMRGTWSASPTKEKSDG